MIFITTITTITTHYYSSITSVLFYLRIHYFSYSHYYCHSSLSVVNLKSHFNPTCIGLFKQLLSKSEKWFVRTHCCKPLGGPVTQCEWGLFYLLVSVSFDSEDLKRLRALTKDMQWASNFLWYMARQSSILSMPTEGFVSASSSSFFSLILLMLCPKSGNWAAASSRKGITSWKFCQILISVQLRCVWRESIHLEYPKSASDQPLQQLLFWIYCRWLEIIFPSARRKFKFI